ncbi:hypothetical protein BGZ68_007061 [Mortierella alpina]|nr:hypothetical protein BGZ68_007061 [Mortierella alpina]
MNNPYGYGVAPPQQQQQQQHAALLPPTNIDPALEGVVKNFLRSEKYVRKIKHLVRATSVPGRQNYKFAPATALTQQETRLWRNNLMQDEIASNNPFWTARWMRVFGIAPRLDDSLLKVPGIKCERLRSADGDARSSTPLHRKETYLDLRDEQNRNWAMDSFTSGIDCAQKGQLDDAIKAYSQAIQIDGKCVEAYVARGCTFANIKKWRAAIMDFRAALNLDPSNISARQYLETTIAQEEEHRHNPSVDAHATGALANPSNTTAFGGDANLDDINEIVLDTDALHNADRRNDNRGNNNERKKKKKKNKGKKRKDNNDGSVRPREMGRDRDDNRDRSRGRSRDRSPDRSRDRRDRGRSRDRTRDKDDDRYSSRPTRRAGSRSRSRSPRTRSKSGSRSRSRTKGRPPHPQDHAADDMKAWSKEKEAPVQDDYSPNVNYDYSPDIQYDHSPKLSQNDPIEERQAPKASLEVSKDISEPSAKADSTDKGEPHPSKNSDDIKDTKAVVDSSGPAAPPTLKGPSEDTKNADLGEGKEQQS